jgi:hypothetical protein
MNDDGTSGRSTKVAAEGGKVGTGGGFLDSIKKIFKRFTP